MYFTLLTEQEYDNFINHHPAHFTQSIEQYRYRKQHNNDVHLVGVKDNNEVLAACLLSEARALKFFKYFYSHKGPVLDFSNASLVDCFFKGLTKYLKKQRTLFVSVDPYILESIRDADGHIIENFDNTNLINQLSKIGYQHQGYPIGYHQKSQIRWLSVLDIKGKSKEAILEDMSYQTRRNIKKTIEMGVQTTVLDISETERFYKLFKMAEERHNFKYRENPNQFFIEAQRMYPNNSMIKLAYIDLNKYLKQLNDKYETLTSQLQILSEKLLENPNSKKTKTQVNQLNDQLTSQNKKIAQTQQLMTTEGHILDLAAALYIFNKDEVYYLSSGSNPKFNQFMGAYALQWDMIQFAKDHDIPRYNFYGVTGDFSDSAEDLGVQQFKKGFNAHVEEYIGDFVKPIRPLFYKLYLTMNK
ncbi:aminoacyltransferase [Staphylococcus simiae]|uniref:aminoacyltransferase n=1 Tax=Staphylococcus simiae TaxID=308354 RepID=UPI001A96F49C|nr:aminoacyltransferase [Staphylococcus simiae]MBO1198140.1 aminoacyltransferase [Staphylococcus simiae]MBO1200316.1 aminoacyltransferase [Staphylococcus simiae]MBO1202520.1 aminoacyltransferase [Staphylococcus simiae]MBO1210202.1 aminoacyltransferase [Staphylococcus simiae]MBO1228664.1 aminoacyltransferase [Staphylococcus simiae]